MRGDPKKPVERKPHERTPCSACPKIPHGKKACPASAVELSAKNLLFLRRYFEWKATGQFPDDAIVRRNAGLIRRAEEDFERRQQRYANELLTLAFTKDK